MVKVHTNEQIGTNIKRGLYLYVIEYLVRNNVARESGRQQKNPTMDAVFIDVGTKTEKFDYRIQDIRIFHY